MTLDENVTNAESRASHGARTSADDPNLNTYSGSTEPMNAGTSSQMGVLGSEGNTVTGKNIRTGLKCQVNAELEPTHLVRLGWLNAFEFYSVDFRLIQLVWRYWCLKCFHTEPMPVRALLLTLVQ